MNHILPLVAVFSLCYATSIQSAEEKINIINDLGITTPITVTLKQENSQKNQKSIKVIKSSDKLFYDPTGDKKVTIEVIMKGQRLQKNFSPSDLNDHVLHINDQAGNKFILLPKQLIPPKKQPIKVTVTRSDKNIMKNYSVAIKNAADDLVSTSSTFKENTDYVLKKPYLRLNNHESTQNFWRNYNTNTIVLIGNTIDGRQKELGSLTVKADDVPKGYEIFFTDNQAHITTPKGEIFHKEFNLAN